MTQNGPYPGGPSWSGGGTPEDPYTEPADPWGEHTTSTNWGGQSATTDYQAHPPTGTGYGQSSLNTPPPSWGPPAPVAPPKRRNTPILALVLVLGLLICGGLGTTAYLLTQGDTPTTPTDPASAATTAPVSDPEPRSSSDARFVAKGQCVRNQGTADRPAMTIVPCASGTYEVLKRVDGRTTGEQDAESKCNKVDGYTKWYFYDSELDSLDFVLCLKER